MTKEIVGFILRASPLWSIPINVLIARISAREAQSGAFPVKTIRVVSGFILILAVLVLVWYWLP